MGYLGYLVMRSSTPSITDLILRAYSAFGGISSWPEFLADFVAATDGTAGALVLVEPRWETMVGMALMGLGDDALQALAEKYGALDPWVGLMRREDTGLELGFSQDLVPDDVLVETEFYQGFLAPHNVHYGMSGVINRTPQGISLITSLRPRSAGPFQPAQLEIIRTLLPHLRQIAALQAAATALSLERDAFRTMIDRMPQCVLLLGAEGRILFRNQAFGRFASEYPALGLQDDRLQLADAALNLNVQRLVQQASAVAVNSAKPFATGRVLVAGGGPGEPLLVEVQPIPQGVPMHFSTGEARAMVVIRELGGRPAIDTEALRSTFGLTPSEAKLATLLAQGMHVADVAAASCVSPHTVKTHLRSILRKTRSSRQAELVSRILTGFQTSGPSR